MHPAGYSGRGRGRGAYGNSSAGFRNGNTNAPPYRQPPPPQQQQQMTPQQKEDVLMAMGRLAAEHLVSSGELPRHVLQNRPPAPAPPFPLQERRPQQHDQTTFPRTFQQDRPPARQHFQFRPPRQFQQRPFAPRPFQGQGRPIAKRPRPSFQGSHPGRFPGRPPFHSGPAPSGKGAAPAGRVTGPDLNDPPAGDGNDGQPVAQSDDTAQTRSLQMDHQPNQS